MTCRNGRFDDQQPGHGPAWTDEPVVVSCGPRGAKTHPGDGLLAVFHALHPISDIYLEGHGQHFTYLVFDRDHESLPIVVEHTSQVSEGH